MAPKRKRNLTGSWSEELPIDILDNIIKRLDLPLHVASFSAVCKLWRYLALGSHMSLRCQLPLCQFVPKRSPLPLLLRSGCQGRGRHHLYSPSQGKKFRAFHLPELCNMWIVGSGAGWLVTVDTTDPQVNLLNPLTGKKIPLPHLSTLPESDLKGDFDDPIPYWYIRKVIVVHYRGSFLAVALVSASKTICFCKIGDSKWTGLQNSPIWVHDVILHNAKLYTINKVGSLHEIDIADPSKVRVVGSMPFRPFSSKCFLVNLGGELVLLVRGIHISKRKNKFPLTVAIDAFKFVEQEPRYYEENPGNLKYKWIPLKSLGHHMVFVGYNYSLSLDSRVYPSCKGNRVYFADYRDDEDDDFGRMTIPWKQTFHDVGECRVINQRVITYNNLCSSSSRMNMVWLSPNLSEELDAEMFPC